MAWISTEELAELVPCSRREIERLKDLGLLESENSGLFASGDVHVVRLMAAFEEAGISLEDVARGVAAGELSFPSGLFLPEPVELSRPTRGSPPGADALPSSCGGSAASSAFRRRPTTASVRTTPSCWS